MNSAHIKNFISVQFSLSLSLFIHYLSRNTQFSQKIYSAYYIKCLNGEIFEKLQHESNQARSYFSARAEFHSDGLTGMTKLIVAFRNFVNAHKNEKNFRQKLFVMRFLVLKKPKMCPETLCFRDTRHCQTAESIDAHTIAHRSCAGEDVSSARILMDLMVNRYFLNVEWGPSLVGSRGRLAFGSVVGVSYLTETLL
jgi:hypothetical protein